jgi:hypothetical protein
VPPKLLSASTVPVLFQDPPPALEAVLSKSAVVGGFNRFSILASHSCGRDLRRVRSSAQAVQMPIIYPSQDVSGRPKTTGYNRRQ